MTRRGCVVGVLIWLVVMALPVCGLILAIRGEVSWQRGPLVEDRIWVVKPDNSSGGNTSSGLAYSQSRIISRGPGDDPTCAQTRVYFWLWRGESQALTYCECYRPAAAGQFESLGNCP